MSRSGYSDDCDGWALIRWRGAVESAIRGRRGQAFLRELLAALDALPEKRLVHEHMQDAVTGEFCALGAVGAARGMNVQALEDVDREDIAQHFGIATALAAEIMFMNDEVWNGNRIPEQRWFYVRSWVAAQLKDHQ